MWVGIISEGGKFTAMDAELLPTSRAVPNQTDNSEYRKLAIHLTDTKDATISVACIPLKQGETQPAWTPDVKAMSEWAPQTEMGDVNADGVFNIADAVLLQKWLLAVPDTVLPDWRAGDMNDDNRLGADDLSVMKRVLMRT
ncbi:MAG: dockerin type I repeat-containing protein [Oscillospiraceae bacterium]|nr:dockerin type I repeat-containing protein [Oscillospiraceae bacterium]MBR3448765.1 dockerin type I repeat-containing protein [Oscillospiraceae bacterium]